jgi:hypothetical protein
MTPRQAYERAGHFAAAGFLPSVRWLYGGLEPNTPHEAAVTVEVEATVENLRKLLDLLNEDDLVQFSDRRISIELQ